VWWRWRDLATAADAMAARLSAPKRLAFIFVRNDFATLVAYLACLRAGLAAALLDRSTPTELALALVERYAPEWLLFCDDGLTQSISRTCYEHVEDAGAPDRIMRLRRVNRCGIHPDLALLLSTSGSTGTPKFVRLSYRNLAVNVRDIVTTLGVTAQDCAITTLPLHYSYGLSVLNSHLAAGAKIVLTDKSMLDGEFWSLIREQQCTFFAGVPHTYKLLAALGIERTGAVSLKTFTQAGGQLDRSLIEHFADVAERRQGRFFVMYGQTEASPRMTTLAWADVRRKLGSVGKPMPSGRIVIMPPEDAGGNGPCLGPHKIGEVCYSGPNVMMGYAHSRADLARGDDLGGTLRTGDVGYLDRDGYLFLTGRLKRIAKLAGIRVSLDDVEQMVSSYCTIGCIEANDGLRVFAIGADDATIARLERDLLARLKLHRSLLHVQSIDVLPLTERGKVDYQKLAGLAEATAPCAG
jgi:acyl-CoA synthetase (AMP-forming)/AMP-acid ligase II